MKRIIGGYGQQSYETYPKGAVDNVSPKNHWKQWYYCEYCHKHIENGTLRHDNIYCNLRHAILGALNGEQR